MQPIKGIYIVDLYFINNMLKVIHMKMEPFIYPCLCTVLLSRVLLYHGKIDQRTC